MAFSLPTALIITGLTSLMIAVFLFILGRNRRSETTYASYLLLAGAYGFNSLRLALQLVVMAQGGGVALNVAADLCYLGFVSLFGLGVRSYATDRPFPRAVALPPCLVALWSVFARSNDVPFPWLASPAHLLGAAIVAVAGRHLWRLHRKSRNLGHLALAWMTWLQAASTLSYPFTRTTWYAPYGFALFALLATALGMGFIISALLEEQAKLRSEMGARKFAEEEQLRAHALVDSIASHSPAGISVFNGGTGQCVLANPALAELTGGSIEGLQSQNFRQLPSWRQAGMTNLAEATLQDGRTRQQEVSLLTSFGKEVVFSAHLARFEVMGEPHLLFIIVDAAPRKQLESQLLQSQKMESIGRLAGGIAHDFNNLLTPILGYAELLKLKTPPHHHTELDRIMEAADKARVLTRQLLSFGRKQILEMKVIDLNQVLSRFYEILRRTIRENVEIGLHLTRYVYGVRADANQLEQIVLNLAINAQDAIEGNGRLTIETAAVTLDEEYAQQHPEVTPGDYLMLAISDSGSGMDLPTLNKIFEPFFTTKTVGKGTGLGLAMVHGLVKQHDGHIWVYSEPGTGTVFKIYFPIVGGAPVDVTVPVAPRTQLSAGSSTILLVEDNEMVRSLVFDLLHDSGHHVLVASGPKEALKVARGERIDLLLTDVVMPDMTGPELYEKLLKEQVQSKVLYMSGYTNNVVVHHGALCEGVNFIQKPFAVKELCHKIETILGA